MTKIADRLARLVRISLLHTGLLAVVGTSFIFGHAAMAEEKLSKFLLIKLSREQSQVLCTSEAFISCMEFTQETCLELSEKALQQCIVPLPDTISLEALSNDALEACPQKVYEEAGFSEEKAKNCLEEILAE